MAESLRVALFNDAPVLARPSLKMKLERVRRTGGGGCVQTLLCTQRPLSDQQWGSLSSPARCRQTGLLLHSAHINIRK